MLGLAAVQAMAAVSPHCRALCGRGCKPFERLLSFNFEGQPVLEFIEVRSCMHSPTGLDWGLFKRGQ